MLTESFHCLAHKLLQLDGESSNFLSPGSGHRSVDEQLAAHQHRCEERARTQVKQEVSRGGWGWRGMSRGGVGVSRVGVGVERDEQGRGRVSRGGVGVERDEQGRGGGGEG